jgi:Phage head-tail joining protein.
VSKRANAGELRTPVYFFRIDRTKDADGYEIETEINIFGSGKAAWCKWVNVHGAEVFDAMQLKLNEPVTLTMRYSALVNRALIVYNDAEHAAALHAGDEIEDEQEAANAVITALQKIRYEVISIDDVENRHVWMEIKIQRQVGAR